MVVGRREGERKDTKTKTLEKREDFNGKRVSDLESNKSTKHLYQSTPLFTSYETSFILSFPVDICFVCLSITFITQLYNK